MKKLIAIGCLLISNTFASLDIAKNLYVEYLGTGDQNSLELAMLVAEDEANRGDAGALDFLGQRWREGFSLNGYRFQDTQKARNYFKLSAEQGNAYGQCHYGKYLMRYGNWDQGMDLIKLSAEQGGCAESLAAYGCKLRNEGNDVEAVGYFMQAANMTPVLFELPFEEGVNYGPYSDIEYIQSSRRSLGLCFLYGIGVERDIDFAAYYLGTARTAFGLSAPAHDYRPIDIPQDPEEAERFFESGIRQYRSSFNSNSDMWHLVMGY
jgi:TPR repeat protein